MIRAPAPPVISRTRETKSSSSVTMTWSAPDARRAPLVALACRRDRNRTFAFDSVDGSQARTTRGRCNDCKLTLFQPADLNQGSVCRHILHPDRSRFCRIKMLGVFGQ